MINCMITLNQQNFVLESGEESAQKRQDYEAANCERFAPWFRLFAHVYRISGKNINSHLTRKGKQIVNRFSDDEWYFADGVG